MIEEIKKTNFTHNPISHQHILSPNFPHSTIPQQFKTTPRFARRIKNKMKSRKNSEKIAVQTLLSKFKNSADDLIEIGFHEKFQSVDTVYEDTKSDMNIIALKKQNTKLKDEQLDTKISPVEKQKNANLKDRHVGKAKKRSDDQTADFEDIYSDKKRRKAKLKDEHFENVKKIEDDHSGKDVLLLKEQKKRIGKKQDVSKVKDKKLGIKPMRGKTKFGIVKPEKSKRKVVKEKKWFGIRTRSSPKQLFKAVTLIKKKQREAVTSMGFGKLLSFKVDGIPAKLGHYVVDMFDEDKMEIRVPNGTIKVDSEAVHRLFGIPNSGIDLESINLAKNLEPSVACWRNLYENYYIGPTEIVTRMAASGDDDSFFFKLDFIILFLSTMVECHTHGKCKLDILHALSGDTDFSNIDWCGYVVNSIKKCKVGWKRCCTKSPFRGALTILTLLYVDSIACPDISVEPTLSAIEFWSMEMLKLREILEIKNGGFGLGEFRGLSVDINHSDKVLVETKEDLDRNHDNYDLLISELEKMFDSIVKDKSRLEKALGSMYTNNPENQEIKIMVKKYESIFKEMPKWSQSCTDEPGKRTDVPSTLIAKLDPDSTEDYGNEGARIMGISDKLNMDDERVDVSGCKKTDGDAH
ncbi:hypothetical protein QVD17_34154 [Tagetes erecta]|uniref:Uncharacterized protein n=1 Tax=Tagetes erecta TaxID=13708 RepID=A0AAD8NL13_TARER|nr:hypothetical protein QVD17_34154 [Tagetes erecta]